MNDMQKFPIPPEIVEAAARAAGENYWSVHNPEQSPTNIEVWKKVAEAAIRTALDELGLRGVTGGTGSVPSDSHWASVVIDDAFEPRELTEAESVMLYESGLGIDVERMWIRPGVRDTEREPTPSLVAVSASNLRAGDLMLLRVDQVLGPNVDGKIERVGIENGPLLPEQQVWRARRPNGS